MMQMTTTRDQLMRGGRSASRHLEGDALDDVDHVLAAVGDRLHRLVQLLPLDDLDRVGPALEEGRELVAQQAVPLLLGAREPYPPRSFGSSRAFRGTPTPGGASWPGYSTTCGAPANPSG